jgi:ABC-type multidrug transport system fused ATPase/permease subunit
MQSGDPLKRLTQRLGLRGARVPLFAVGVLAAIIPPLLLVLLGFFIETVSVGNGLPTAESVVHLGPFLKITAATIGTKGGLQLLVMLVAFGLGLGIAYALLLLAYYRMVYQFAINAAIQCYVQAATKNEELAVSRGVSGQNAELAQWFENHIPNIRTSLFAWQKSWPRLAVQALLFLLIAALMNFWITATALICIGLLGQFVSWLTAHQKSKAPAVLQKVWQYEQRLAEVCRSIALLSTVRSKASAHELLNEEVKHFRAAAATLAASQSWKTPLLICFSAGLISIFCVVLGIQLLDRRYNFDLASAITLGLAICGVALSLVRLQKQRNSLPLAKKVASEVLTFLDTPVPLINSSSTANKHPLSLSNRMLIEHVTLEDSHGRRLLHDVSLDLKPKQVVAVVSSRAVESKTLVELMLGFGRPVSGRMVFDEHLVSDIDPEDFPKKCIWVSATGPLLQGTIEDNLRGGFSHRDMVDLTDAVRTVNAYDAVQQFENGLSTLVTMDDDRLNHDLRYRLGLARALLKAPALIVAEEPDVPVSLPIETATTDAAKKLAETGPLVVVLPKRLTTLRTADLVVLVHDHTVVEVGTHADLIQRSELYRHLTYVRFSPLREVL